jgi:hypothetical protein
MSGETFVDLTYRGLELGRRHRLCEVGPTTAYLEYPTPMPVGSRLELAADGGVQLAVEVVRVHEQVAGAERSPGMRVRAPALDERAASWWRTLVSVADPAPLVIASGPASATAEASPARDDVDTTVVDADLPVDDDSARSTAVMPAVEARRTEVMSAVDIEAIMATAEDSEPSGNHPVDPAGSKKKRGGRKRGPKK